VAAFLHRDRINGARSLHLHFKCFSRIAIVEMQLIKSGKRTWCLAAKTMARILAKNRWRKLSLSLLEATSEL